MVDRSKSDSGGIAAHLLSDERLLEERRIAGAAVGVTDRRLVVCSADGTGDIRAVDRTSVRAVEFRSSNDRDQLLPAALWAGLGVFLLVGGGFLPSGGLFRPIDPPSAVGLDGLFEAVNRSIALLSYLEPRFSPWPPCRSSGPAIGFCGTSGAGRTSSRWPSLAASRFEFRLRTPRNRPPNSDRCWPSATTDHRPTAVADISGERLRRLPNRSKL